MSHRAKVMSRSAAIGSHSEHERGSTPNWHNACSSWGAARLAEGDDEMKNVLNKVLPLMLAFAGLVSTVACTETESGEGEGE